MNKQDIHLLYKYNTWANLRILDAAAKVTHEQFIAPASYPHGGLHSTLTHILFAEWLWRMRWQGESPTQGLKPEDFPTFDALRARWAEEEKAIADFVDALTDKRLNDVLQYKTTHGDAMENILWQMMAHVVNHGTQHRGEAAVILTDMNSSPGDIDLIVFLRR